MSKRYRFVIILVVAAICFVFLFPSIRWYFLVPEGRKAAALQSREQIKIETSRRAQADLQRLLAAAADGGDVPGDLSFLVPEAKKLYRKAKAAVPGTLDAKTLLSAFSGRSEAQEAIETKYRNDIFALKDLQKNAVQLGLDLSGGLSIILQVGRTLSDDDPEDAMNRALEVLNSRIDRFGLTEPVIRRQGADQIYVEIPGSADPERINSIIMGKGGLAFHLVDGEATDEFAVYYQAHPTDTFDGEGNLLSPGVIPAGTMVLGVYGKDRYGLDEFSGRYVVVKEEVGLDGNHIRSATVERDRDGKPAISVALDSEGGDIFYKLTSANVGKQLAIVLDDRVKSYPVVETPIRDTMQISGFGGEEAANLALTLRTAALPVELEVVNMQSVGPSMGADTIRQGLYALLGGIAVVLVFMMVFYRAAGINAVVAQLLNFYFMFSILSAFNFTLTLPSIAGFILTIGMAVDANVIIFERMKEELRLGKGRKAVVEAGFDKAFWAIMDSNITTFIAALFLSQLGSGPIQGFAVSLAIGVFSSVFTALFVSRLIFDFSTDVLHSRRVSVGWLSRRNPGGTGEAA
ncbi:MAG: protein translocase subunit SecD [Treponema sp.]|jgi:preprotein translocase subunit SecD|nr:protein translocase subunit SecD [Treponema sp.]